MLHQYRTWYLHHRFAVLFYSLLAVIGLGPSFALLGLNRDILVAMLGATQILALYDSRSRLLIYGIAPTAVIVTTHLANVWFEHEAIPLTTSPFFVILTFITALTTFRHSLKAPEVNSETIYSALSAYLLTAMCLGFTYWVVKQALPGSFSINGSTSVADFELGTAVYFSFVTITTTGYGDILPLTPITRSLAMAEALIGQLYLACMVARLIGSYTNKPSQLR